MSDPFDNINLLRIILEGESDDDSPGSEEFFSQLRENWEVLTMLAFYTGDSGTATSDPSETVLTDTAASYDTDEHNGRSLVIIDGTAAGNIYTIDDTTATTLTCTGDTLYSDGVRSGDKYKIFYDLKNTSAHTHDDIDSPLVSLPNGKIMLPHYMSEDDSELISDNNDSTWTTMSNVRTFRIYIPTNALNLRCAMRIRRQTGGSNENEFRFDVGGSDSSAVTITSGSYAWETGALLDVSALTGWYDLTFEHRASSGTQYGYIQGFSFIWEN